MLTPEMQKGIGKAVLAIPVIVTAARPMAVVGKKLAHQIKQLHGFGNFRFGHGLSAQIRAKNSAYHRRPQFGRC
jgi:hypothetical protein